MNRWRPNAPACAGYFPVAKPCPPSCAIGCSRNCRRTGTIIAKPCWRRTLRRAPIRSTIWRFWNANSLREGAAKLDKNSAYRQIVDDGLAQNLQLAQQVRAFAPRHPRPAGGDHGQPLVQGLQVADDASTLLLGSLSRAYNATSAAQPGRSYQGPYGYVIE